jgi:hypothetical protein
MTYIQPVRHDKLSLFMSAVDELILRRHQVHADPASGQVSGAASRPDMRHPYVQAATAYCRSVQHGEPAPEAPPEDLRASLGSSADIVWTCTKLAGEYFLTRIGGNRERAARLHDDLKESTCDPGWVEVLDDYLAYFELGKKRAIPYVRYNRMDDFVLDILPANATVALISDWGTGTESARQLLKQVARQQPDVVIHLGDIYYAGTARETRNNFLDVCNQALDRARTRIPVYTLAGNHDMYSGGAGYYALIAQLNPAPPFDPAARQPASYFCLRSQDGAWQFLAMDTGLHDHDPFEVADAMTYLEPAEVVWHMDKINRFHQAGGRTVLLSHHQLFSAFSRIGNPDAQKPSGREAFNTKLLASFGEVMEQGKIAAWFWGHEHNLSVYQPYPPLAKGRCIGNGAIPVFSNPYTVVPAVPHPPVLVSDPHTGAPLTPGVNPEKVYNYGYVICRLNDAERTMEVCYYQNTDEQTPLYRERLP